MTGLHDLQDAEGYVAFKSFGEGTNLPAIATEEDTGPLTHALIQAPAGQNLIGVRKWIQMEDFAEAFGRTLGVPARISQEPNSPDSFPEELREEFMDSVGYMAGYGYDAGTVDKSVVQPDEVRRATSSSEYEIANAGAAWSAIEARDSGGLDQETRLVRYCLVCS